MAEQRPHSKTPTPRPRGFLLYRELSVINYNVLSSPKNRIACAPGSHAVRKRELVLRYIAEKEVAARAEAQTQTRTRRGRLLQRAGGRARGSRGSATALEQKQQRCHAVVPSQPSAHYEVEEVSSFFRDAIEISEEDETAFHAELAQFD